jgi:hypothetical protein
VRLLLDESLPRPLINLLVGHEARTVTQVGWSGLSNGVLLRRAADTFDAFLTADQNIEFQQNPQTLPLAIVVVVAASNRLESLEPLVPEVLRVLETLEPGILVRVGA